MTIRKRDNMKQKFKMTNKMIEHATAKIKEYDNSFKFGMDNQSLELISIYGAVYEALPFDNLKEFEQWLKIDDCAYNVETIHNLMTTNKPIREYLNDDLSKIFENYFDCYFKEDDIKPEHKDLFTDLCFMIDFYNNFANTLDYGNFRNKIIKMKRTTILALINIYELHKVDLSLLDEFTKYMIEISSYYTKHKTA